ncbi:hypothetical protein Patl1_15475 [Pistacia atlantica]|uniref:Uncharacterized protein n=1 Tax=Pistacia atlantica TaxID=434234 RepID=A0ACC1B951_9ROSI|nr:hypothetical protein Patl1_15475 [Pistacia atlantica]
MYCLSCSHYTTLASLTNNSSSTSPQTNHPTNPPSRKPKIPRKNNTQQQKQLQLMEIERAIGAGTFRDNEPMQVPLRICCGTGNSNITRMTLLIVNHDESCKSDILILFTVIMDLEKQKKIVFNGILPDLSGVFEGPVEKQLRETGEWFSSHTEKRLRSSSIDFSLISSIFQ